MTILLAPLLWRPPPSPPLSPRTPVPRLIQALTSTAAVLGTDPRSARDNLTAVMGHIEAIRGHAARAREAGRSLRFNPLHRRSRESVTRLARSLATADQLTPHLVNLARETVVFTGRDDLAPVLADARRYLPVLASATAEASTDTLNEESPRQAQAGARYDLAAYARTGSRPAATALRRPFQQILDDLERRSTAWT